MLNCGAIVFILIELGMPNVMATILVTISPMILGSNEIKKPIVAEFFQITEQLSFAGLRMMAL